MNRAYNDNNEYTEAMAGLKFSDEAKARMVQNLLDARERAEDNVVAMPRARKRRLPRIAAVGVAAAVVLTVGASATGVLRSAGEAFQGMFGPTADTEIIDKIGRPVGASDTDNGVTVTADAIIGDKYHYAVTYSIAKVDGTAFDIDLTNTVGDGVLPLTFARGGHHAVRLLRRHTRRLVLLRRRPGGQCNPVCRDPRDQRRRGARPHSAREVHRPLRV